MPISAHSIIHMEKAWDLSALLGLVSDENPGGDAYSTSGLIDLDSIGPNRGVPCWFHGFLPALLPSPFFPNSLFLKVSPVFQHNSCTSWSTLSDCYWMIYDD